MSFTDAPAPDYGKDFVSELRKRNKHIVLVFFRNKNQNVVVCEAIKRDSSIALDIYWLDIDPAYRQPRRKQGILHDRNELLTIERELAYGAISTPIDAKTCFVRFNAVPQYLCKLTMNEDGSKLVFNYENQDYRLRSVNIIANDTLQFLLNSAILKKLQVNMLNESTMRPAILERCESGELILTHR